MRGHSHRKRKLSSEEPNHRNGCRVVDSGVAACASKNLLQLRVLHANSDRVCIAEDLRALAILASSVLNPSVPLRWRATNFPALLAAATHPPLKFSEHVLPSPSSSTSTVLLSNLPPPSISPRSLSTTSRTSLAASLVCATTTCGGRGARSRLWSNSCVGGERACTIANSCC